MFGATAVAQEHLVLLAGTAAIAVVVALGQKGTKQAVLHVEQGHVLVQGQFHPPRRAAGHQLQQLVEGQVVAGGNPLQAPALQQPGGRERVGHIQAEIADAGGLQAEALQLVGVAHQVAIGLGPQQGLQAPALIGPADALARQPQAPGPAAPPHRHGLAQLVRVFDVDHHPVDRLLQ